MGFVNYDAWRLASPSEYYDEHEVGMEEGEVCNRFPEPDEDAPRRWRPRPCGGLMVMSEDGICVCERCGATA
jgi:hypothetical protein